MKIPCFLIILTFSFFIACPQTTSDVLENGIKIKNGDDVYLQFDGTQIKHRIAKNSIDLRFKQIPDSAMLLPVESSVLIYMRPLNPLNFVYKAENKLILDPIEQAAAMALTSIGDLLNGRLSGELKNFENSAKKNPKVEEATFCPNISKQVDDYGAIVTLLTKDKKDQIKTIFNDLKKLGFEEKTNTEEGVKRAGDEISGIATHFNSVQEKIQSLKDDLSKITCSDKVEEFIVKQVFATSLKDLEVTFSNQKKRFTNLEKTFKMVQSKQQEASKDNWLVFVQDVPAKRGSISVFTIKVNETGYKLSDEGEIVESETKENTSKVLRFRRFQRFVPEVSVGVAFTDLSFPKFSANSDANGKHFVVEAGEDKINRVNFTTMINYSLFMKNSPLHPFWQIGIGVNADFPTFLTGIGMRVNALGAKRLALAFGIATTWIKTLDKLKVGDPVSGPGDVEKDVKYKFNTKPKPYFGIQYNF